MKILDFVRPDLILPDVRAVDKQAVLDELATHMAKSLAAAPASGQPAQSTPPASSAPAIDREALLRVLVERERLASTAIGEGVAIPHGKLATVNRLVGCIGRSVAGVNFDSMDGRPTHIFFVLIAPENSTGIHLKALARISRLFKDPEFRTRIMQAKDGAEMYRVLADEDAKF